MIPIYDLGPLSGPKIIASKLKFPIWKKYGIIDNSEKCLSAMQILCHLMI
jgi:hypothetical protein